VIVADSKLLAARAFRSTQNDLALRVERKDPLWILPLLWRYEFLNILAKTIGAGRISPESARIIWRSTVASVRANECDPSPDAVIDLAGRFRITAYDACFIALALEWGAPCVTEDRELRAKFPGVAISMRDFLELDSKHSAVREGKAAYPARKKRT
jgi:predicted nucleic acid-binding protein